MGVSVIARGDVVQVNLDPTVGTEMKKSRPCVVVQNDAGNRTSQRTIVVPATGAEHVVKQFPIYVPVAAGDGGFTKNSVILCDQIRAVDKGRLVKTLGRLSPSSMERVDAALKVSLSLR
jgi:mRNA interferase MazF